MNLQKLPLAERIQRYRDGHVTYPEYIPSVIRRLGQTPVLAYLTGIDPKQQRRFSDLTGLCHEDAAYQAAALRVAGLKPPAAAEAMRILAEPMIRYAAMADSDSLPPPRYPPPPLPRPAPGEKRPLATRLRQAAYNSGSTPFFHIYCLRTDAYFYNLDAILGGSSYGDMLEILIDSSPRLYEALPWLPQFVYNSRELPQEDQTQLLYQTLIRPFAEFEKERIENECRLSLPF